MPELVNPRWEAYCQQRARGKSRADSWLAASPTCKSRMGAQTRGHGLEKKIAITARIEELRDPNGGETSSADLVDREYLLRTAAEILEMTLRPVSIEEVTGEIQTLVAECGGTWSPVHEGRLESMLKRYAEKANVGVARQMLVDLGKEVGMFGAKRDVLDENELGRISDEDFLARARRFPDLLRQHGMSHLIQTKAEAAAAEVPEG